jgi:hypothetical protein
MTKQDFVIDKTDAAWERGSEVKENQIYKNKDYKLLGEY